MKKINFIRFFFPVSVALAACGCGSLPSAGPYAGDIKETKSALQNYPVKVVDLDDYVAKRVANSGKRARFSDVFSNSKPVDFKIGSGDVIEIFVWEAPPAILFSSGAVADVRLGPATTKSNSFPEQTVPTHGVINFPFVGDIKVADKTPHEVELEIARRLQGKANQPQVIVRVTRNASANVTVVGEVAQSLRMPLTPKGERLLDAVAAAGGVRLPVGKMTLQITRGEVVQAMALDSVILDPAQNIFLQSGDVVTALYQPLSFTALGATGKNEEIPFEAQGISLAQALARSGGLQDQRADAKGVFIFRYEEPLVLGVAGENPPLTPDGKVPVIYRVDLKDPRSFFIAQSFPIRNKDVMYVSNAPVSEIQKFMNVLTSIVFTAQGLGAIGR